MWRNHITSVWAVVLLLASVPAEAEVPGDVTGDGTVNVADVQCTLMAVLKAESPGCLASAEAADINCDSLTNVADVQLMVLLALAYPQPGLPPGLDDNSNNVVDDCEGWPCGDGSCLAHLGENCWTCPVDCGMCCGDGVCQWYFSEFWHNCPQDCGESPYVCGNGLTEPGESCDDGNLVDGDGCDSECEKDGVCGNGIVEPGETCDDGNLVPWDGCGPDCKTEGPDPLCGNGIVELPETCDDGNQVDGDGCESDCHPPAPFCGDGAVDWILDEQCDPPEQENSWGVYCNDDCQWVDPCPGACCPEPCCGDGKVNPPEECDDMNFIEGDGCNSQCKVEIPVPSILGTVFFNGPDLVFGSLLSVMIVDEKPESWLSVEAPVMGSSYVSPQFPLDYVVKEFGPGSYWVVVTLDVHGDGLDKFDVGAVSDSAIVVGEDDVLEGVDMVLELLPLGTVSGTVTFPGGSLEPGQHLMFGAMESIPGPPVASVLFDDAVSPFPYVLNHVPDGDYYVTGVLYLSGNIGPPGAGDKIGLFPSMVAPVKVTVVEGEETSGIDFVIDSDAPGP